MTACPVCNTDLVNCAHCGSPLCPTGKCTDRRAARDAAGRLYCDPICRDAATPLPDAHEHAPVIYLNRTGDGIRTYLACSCGATPKRMPQSSTGRPASYLAHRRKLGLPRLPDVSHAVYGEGPARGMTWDQWHAKNPGLDPFTGATS